MGFPHKAKKWRQDVINEFLAATGSNVFYAQAFVDYVSERPKHVLHSVLFGKEDADLANEWRLGYVRGFISRIKVHVPQEELPENPRSITVRYSDQPVFVSPIVSRKVGGGYIGSAGEDGQLELAAQGAKALHAWLVRFTIVSERMGVDVTPIEKIAVKLSQSVVVPSRLFLVKAVEVWPGMAWHGTARQGGRDMAW